MNLYLEPGMVPDNVVDVIVEEGVTKIEAETFYERKQLRSIAFPESLEEIEDRAFHSCPRLYYIHSFIPQNVIQIGHWAFYDCNDLREVILNKSSKLKGIGNYAFYKCTSPQSIVIPKSVMTMGEEMFRDCHYLESVLFEESSQLQIIPSGFVEYCRKLNTIIVPDAVNTIEKNAFRHCDCLTKCPNLQFINLPSTIISSVHNEPFDQCDALSITATILDQDQQLQWFQHGYDNIPLHQLCYSNIHSLTRDKLDSISINGSSLIEQDECGHTPLYIVCSNPHTNTSIIKQVHNKHPEAATKVNTKDMTPWHMYLVMKGVIVYPEFRAILNGHDSYPDFHNYEVEVSGIAKALLRKDEVLNDIHSLIAMGLDVDDVDLYDVTLALHENSTFDQECNRFNETSGLYPFMAMAASNEYQLCHVYDMALKTCVHNFHK